MNPIISVILKNPLPNPRSQIFLLCFLLGVYILILALGFWFIDHFKFMFVNAVSGPSFLFWVQGYLTVPAPFFKIKYLFLIRR